MWYYLYPDTKLTEEMPFYIQSIGLHEFQGTIVRPLGHPYDQLFYSSSGTGILKIKNKRYELSEKSAFFIPANVPHEYYPTGEVWDIRWLVIAGDQAGSILRALKYKPGAYYDIDVASLEIIFNKMHHLLLLNESLGNVYATAQLQDFLTTFALQCGFIPQIQSVKPSHQAYISTIVDYVAYHFMHEIKSSELCEITGISNQHLCRIVKEATGMTVIEYINFVRIKKSKELLINSDLCIEDIARECGFKNNNYFWRTFKKYEGVTPGEFRKNKLI